MNKILLALLLLSTFSLYAQDTLPIEEGSQPVLEESFKTNEQMTPSLKIRRHVIRAAYGERLDALYKK